DAEQAGIAQLLEDLMRREDLVLFPFVDMRIDVAVDDGAQRAADFGVFRGELQGGSPSRTRERRKRKPRSVSSRAKRGTFGERRERSLAALGKTVSLASAVTQTGQCPHELGDDLQHDLVGAAADRAQAAVAIAACHRVVPEVTRAAPVLQAGVGDLAAQA